MTNLNGPRYPHQNDDYIVASLSGKLTEEGFTYLRDNCTRILGCKYPSVLSIVIGHLMDYRGFHKQVYLKFGLNAAVNLADEMDLPDKESEECFACLYWWIISTGFLLKREPFGVGKSYEDIFPSNAVLSHYLEIALNA